MDFDYILLDITERMSNFTLQELYRPAQCETKQAIIQELPDPSPNEIPLMRSPQHLHDHYKIGWLAKDQTPVELLMSQHFPQQDQYLDQYYKLVTGAGSPFSFVQVYPHTLNLMANRRYRQHEVIAQIKKEWFIGGSEFIQTKICNYLSTIKSLIQFNVDVFANPNQKDLITKNIDLCLEQQHSLYIFELRFIMDIVNSPRPAGIMQEAQWLYFKLLPSNFDYMPVNHATLVKKYHSKIGHCLQGYREQIEQCLLTIKSLISDQSFKAQYTFSSFLKLTQPAGNSIFLRYQQQLNSENYIWAKNCQRSRIYSQSQQQSHAPNNAFVPLLDLFHHSSRQANVGWEFNQQSGSMKVYALRQIECGQLLHACYSPMPIQAQYIYYGFVEVDSECYLDIPVHYDATLITQILEVWSQQKFKPKAKEEIKAYAKQHRESIVLSVKSMHRLQSSSEYLGHSCLSQLVLIAQQVPMMIYKKVQSKKHHRFRFYSKSYKQRKLINSIHEEIRRSIHNSTERKKIIRDALVGQIRSTAGRISFEQEYNLRCICTILNVELKVLEGLARSIVIE